MSGSSSSASLRVLKLPWRRVAAVLGLSFIVACSGGSGGGGCGTLAKIPNGYPVDKRIDNAIQLRITKAFFDFLEVNGKAFVDKFLPGGGEIAVPSSCGGDTELCCGQMCKVKLDFQSLKFDPKPPSTTQATLRAKIKTLEDFKIKTKVSFVTIDCKLSLDTARKGKADVGITMAVVTNTSPATKLTSLDFDDKSVDILDLDSDDIDIKGNLLCGTVNLLKGLFIGTLKDQLKRQLSGPLDSLMCQKCAAKADCSSLANQGCVNNFCMRDGSCLQFIGAEGRIDLGSALGAFSPAAKTAGLDLIAAAGNYSSVEALPTAGMSFGMLGGTASYNRSTCVPARPAPVGPGPTKSAAFSGNTTPSGKPYHIGAGISNLELDSVGYTLYDTGGLCLDVGTAQVEMLSSGLLSALIPSINDLTRGINSAVKIVGRPQQPPTFRLGKGTFKTDAMGKKVIDDPLLHVVVKDMALDFYVFIDERYVRFMRQTVDLDLPLGLDVDAMNQIVPLLGDIAQAVGNVRVSDSSLLKESPTQLARLFPSLLPVLAGSLGSALSPIKLPDIMGIQLSPVQITSTTDPSGKLSILGLFLALKLSTMPLAGDDMSLLPQAADEPTETMAELTSLTVPTADELAITAVEQKTPRVVLQLAARSSLSGEREWQYRIDGGLWRPFDSQSQLILEEPELRLAGRHNIEVRARIAGLPGTLDPTPAKVELVVAPAPAPKAAAQPAPKASSPASVQSTSKSSDRTLVEDTLTGCSISQKDTGRGTLIVMIVALVGLLSRRRLLRVGTLALLALLGQSQSACNKNGNGNGDDNKPPVEVKKAKAEFAPVDEIGRYQSIAVEAGQLYISAYNSTFGDLAFTEMKSPSNQSTWLPVDGLPSGEPETTDPAAYRGGYVDPADDVGRFTSLQLTQNKSPVVVYQDVTNSAVKLARRSGDKWSTLVIADQSEGLGVGAFAQLLLDGSDVPTVAYMVAGQKKADGKVFSQLVVAQAMSADPQGPSDFTKKVVEEVQVPCAGLCGTGEACVYADPTVKDVTKTVCKKTDSCTPSCKTGLACIAAKCVDALGTPAADLPKGTGLFARLLQNASGKALVFYNRATGALKLASGADWKVTTLDGGDGKNDLGRHIGAALGTDDTLHVAYSSPEGRLYYRSAKGTMLGKVELVDDGSRTMPTPDIHQVGAGATLILDEAGPVIAYQDSTSGTLEIARKTTTWSRKSVSAEPGQNRGYYPQLFKFDGKWWASDVVYDRNADALTTLRFTDLTTQQP
jgi:hypothetical protein